MNTRNLMTGSERKAKAAANRAALLSRLPERFQNYVASIPAKYQTLLLKSLLRQNPRSAAIKAKCVECVGFEEAESRIRDCSTWKCPLRAYRPYQ